MIDCAKKYAYPTDFEATLPDELLQFSSFLNTEFVKKSLEAIPATSSAAMPETFPDDSEETESVTVVTKDDDDVRLDVESIWNCGYTGLLWPTIWKQYFLILLSFFGFI